MTTLAGNKGEWQPRTFSAKELRNLVIQLFPELKFGPADEIHLVFPVLAERCRRAIAESDFDGLRKVFNSLNEAIALKGADPEIESAIQISFLLLEDFSSPNGKRAFELLPERIKKLIVAA